LMWNDVLVERIPSTSVTISKRDFAIACSNYAAVAVRRVSRATSRLASGRSACPSYGKDVLRALLASGPLEGEVSGS
jgi:hypothetical protein